MLPGFRHLPFNDLETAREAIRPETVAFMLETVQGEGGVNCVTPEFLRGLAQLCREHDLLLLMDEVQCGFGRCGDIMGWRAVAPDVEPDGISWAKALGGVPGAVAEAHALHLPFDGVPPPDGALGQGGGLAVLFIQKIEHKRLTAPDMRSSERG